MVAMYMAYEHSTEAVEAYLRATHLQLRTLATVDEKLLLAYLHHLRRRVMAQRWQRTATTEYMYLEWFHCLHYLHKHFYFCRLNVKMPF